jgi:hypothetical protein
MRGFEGGNPQEKTRKKRVSIGGTEAVKKAPNRDVGAECF